MKTTANIKDINIWDNNPGQYNPSQIVRIEFKFPCTWTTLTIDELLEILRLWIIAEEQRYPKPQFKGRDMLFDKIKEVFKDENKEKKQIYD